MIVSVVGTALDVAAVANISSKLVKAGRVFEESKDINQAKKILEESGLDSDTQAKVVAALEKERVKPTTSDKIEPEAVNEKVEVKEKIKTEGKEETQLTNMGRDIPPLTQEELTRVLQLQEIRNKFLKDWREKNFSSFDIDLQIRLEKVSNSIIENLTPDDIAAVIKEERGVQILRPNGTPFNHIDENKQAVKSIIKTIKELEIQMNRDVANHSKYEALLSSLSNLKDEMTRIINK